MRDESIHSQLVEASSLHELLRSYLNGRAVFAWVFTACTRTFIKHHDANTAFAYSVLWLTGCVDCLALWHGRINPWLMRVAFREFRQIQVSEGDSP